MPPVAWRDVPPRHRKLVCDAIRHGGEQRSRPAERTAFAAAAAHLSRPARPRPATGTNTHAIGHRLAAGGPIKAGAVEELSAALVAHGTVTATAIALGVTHRTLCRWRRHHPDLRQAMDDALARARAASGS